MNQWEWDLLENKTPVDSIDVRGAQLREGDPVKLRPRAGGDVFDLALEDKLASIKSIEQDYEGQLHLAVVVDDDPGRDIGLMRQPGHRFFFRPEEVDPAPHDAAAQPVAGKKILIAGIGNIFQADDGFGVAVAARLVGHTFPPGVRAVDFGIRGFDLAYALLDGYETTILVDAYSGEGAPGTLFVVEPELNDLNDGAGQAGVEPHAMNPLNVLRMAASMSGQLKRILLLGCVPFTLGPEEGHMGLSEPVEAAVDEAVKPVDSLVARILAGEAIGPGAAHQLRAVGVQHIPREGTDTVCLAIPAKIVEFDAKAADLAWVEVAGVRRKVELGLLLDDPPVLGDWVLVHVGFAMSKISEADAEEQMRMLMLLGESDAAMEEVRGYGLEGESPTPAPQERKT